MACAEDNRDSGPYFQQFRCEIHPCKVGHCMIRNNKIESIGFFPEVLQRLCTARGCNNIIAELAQSLFVQLNEDILVIDDKDAFFPPCFCKGRKPSLESFCPLTVGKYI